MFPLIRLSALFSLLLVGVTQAADVNTVKEARDTVEVDCAKGDSARLVEQRAIDKNKLLWQGGNIVRFADEDGKYAPQLREVYARSVAPVNEYRCKVGLVYKYAPQSRAGDDELQAKNARSTDYFGKKASTSAGKLAEGFQAMRHEALVNPARDGLVSVFQDATDCARQTFTIQVANRPVVVDGRAGMQTALDWNYDARTCFAPLLSKLSALGIAYSETGNGFVVKSKGSIVTKDNIGLVVDDVFVKSVLERTVIDFTLLINDSQYQINMAGNGKFVTKMSGSKQYMYSLTEDPNDLVRALDIGVLREACLQVGFRGVIGELGGEDKHLEGCSIDESTMHHTGMFNTQFAYGVQPVNMDAANRVIPLGVFNGVLPLTNKYLLADDGGVIVRDTKKQLSPVFTDINKGKFEVEAEEKYTFGGGYIQDHWIEPKLRDIASPYAWKTLTEIDCEPAYFCENKANTPAHFFGSEPEEKGVIGRSSSDWNFQIESW